MVAPTVDPEEVHEVLFFSGIEGELLRRVTGAASRRRLSSGESLFHAGDSITHFYYLRSGCVQLSRASRNGGEKVITLVEPGETFAEALIFEPGEGGYPVDARAVADSELFAFCTQTVRGLLRDSPDTCFQIMGVMSRRLKELVDHIEDITLHDATYRLAAYLLRQLPQDAAYARDIQLVVPKLVIASRLSIQPETFSRTLASLRREGLVDTDGAHIVLKDVEGLRRIVEA